MHINRVHNIRKCKNNLKTIKYAPPTEDIATWRIRYQLATVHVKVALAVDEGTNGNRPAPEVHEIRRKCDLEEKERHTEEIGEREKEGD